MDEIAKLFPDSVRATILNNDLINKANVSWTNDEMRQLMILWQQYVEPSMKISCPLCYERVLNNFRQLQNVLIELEKESRLLNGQ